MKKDKNEELQSRREFFKSAAKAALPIIGAAVLASAPSILQASETESSGCQYGCMYSCYGCSGTCSGPCTAACSRSCSGSCSGGCRGGSYY